MPIVVTQEPSSKRTSAEFINLLADVPEHCWPVVTEFSVNFRCLLINVNELDDKGLAKGSRIDAAIRAMATIRNFDKKDLPGMLKRLLHVPVPDRVRMFISAFGYDCDYNEHITRNDILSLETKTPEEQQTVSAVEAFREEGRQEVYSAMEDFLKKTSKKASKKVLKNTSRNTSKKALKKVLKKALKKASSKPVRKLPRTCCEKV